MTLSNKEYNQMSLDAVNYARAIGTTNTELADKLFAVFDHEYRELSKRMSEVVEITHACPTKKWYRTHKINECKADIHLANLVVGTQKDVVNNCIDAMKAVVDAMGR